MAEDWAHRTLDKRSELRSIVEWMTQTIEGERVVVASLVDVKLFLVRSVVPGSLSGSDDPISDMICGVQSHFPVEVSRTSLRLSAGTWSVQPKR